MIAKFSPIVYLIGILISWCTYFLARCAKISDAEKIDARVTGIRTRIE